MSLPLTEQRAFHLSHKKAQKAQTKLDSALCFLCLFVAYERLANDEGLGRVLSLETERQERPRCGAFKKPTRTDAKSMMPGG